MARNKTPKALKVVPPIGAEESLTPEQQQIQALSQQLQATRTELAVLKQMYAEVSVQGRIAMAEREQLIVQLQSAQQTIQQLTEKATEKKPDEAPPAEQPEG